MVQYPQQMDIRGLSTCRVVDESPFTLFPTNGRVFVWPIILSEAYDVDCLRPTGKHIGGSIMVWTTISWHSAVPLSYYMIRSQQCIENSGVTRSIQWCKSYFQTGMPSSRIIMPPFTPLPGPVQERLHEHTLMKFNIFPGPRTEYHRAPVGSSGNQGWASISTSFIST